MSIRRRPNYTAAEVEGLVRAYQELREKRGTYRGGLIVLAKLADLDRAVEQLSLRSQAVVLLHGLLGLTQEATAQLLSVSQKTISKRYRIALEEIHWHINGGIE